MAAHQAPLSLGFSRQEYWSGLPFPIQCMLGCFSGVQLCATLWTAAHKAPLTRGFSRQEYWSGLPFPSPQWTWTWVWVNSGSWWWTGRPGVAAVRGVTKSRMRLSSWTELNRGPVSSQHRVKNCLLPLNSFFSILHPSTPWPPKDTQSKFSFQCIWLLGA